MTHHLTFIAEWLDREADSPACRNALDRAEGKDLSRVCWQFLGAILSEVPVKRANILAVVNPVIAGMDRLAEGKDWPEAEKATLAAWAAADAAWAAAAAESAEAAGWSAFAATGALVAAAKEELAKDRVAARTASWAAMSAEEAGVPVTRQRDLFLQLVQGKLD
jgi:hypothetical protein